MILGENKMPIRGNERSTVIELISDINVFISDRDIIIKRAGGELTLTGNPTALFPDIMLFSDTARTHVLQGWEAKMPDVPITDETLIDNATQKAILLGTNSFVLWNFKSARLYIKGQTGNYSIIKGWDVPEIVSREDVDRYEANWKHILHNILLELNEFLLKGLLVATNVENILSENIGSMLLKRNKNVVADFINNSSLTDTRISAFLTGWWRSYSAEYNNDETDVTKAYAKTIVLHWFNRFVFANLIKKYFNAAREVEYINTETSIEQANNVFNYITNRCDFYSIFASIQYGELIPDSTWRDFVTVNQFLIENDFSSLSQESLQKILENTVNIAKREIRGQYTTPEILADILARISIRNLVEDVFDPCCGTGTIVKAAKNYKMERLNAKTAIDTIWAEDKDSYPLQIAQLALSDINNFNIPLKIFKKNIFDLEKSTNIDIVAPTDGRILHFFLPEFGTIISNLPFIAFENILSEDEIKINEINSRLEGYGVHIDSRSDIYIPIIFALHKHLKPNGTLGVIVSNSWLATKAGDLFYRALLKLFHIEQVHISGKGKWFANAQVITTILILHKRCDNDNISDVPETNFFLWKRSLPELADLELRENLILTSLQNLEVDGDIVKSKKYSQEMIDAILSYNLSKNTLFHNVSWITEIGDKLCRKNTIFKVFRGERRGKNKMFYPPIGTKIDPEFIRPALVSSKSLTTFQAVPDRQAFCCSLSIEELQENGKTNTLSWINRFKYERNGKGKPLPEVLTRSNRFWYEMDFSATAEIVTGMNPDKRLFYAYSSMPILIDQRFIGFRFLDANTNKELCFALLNSIFDMFIIEATSFGRGQGVLDLNAGNISDSFMLNPNYLTNEQAVAIAQAFQPIKNRQVFDTETELQQEDRINFDHVVLKAFGIDNYYDRIKESLLSMQKTRRNVREN